MTFGVSINDQIQRSQQQMEKILRKSNVIHSIQFYHIIWFCKYPHGIHEKQTNTSPGISKFSNNLFQMVTFPCTLLKQVTSAHSKASQELSKIKCIT